MKVIWRDQAKLDYNDALRYLSLRNPQAAASLRQEIRRKLLVLKEQPHIGRRGRADGTREIIIYPYVLAYSFNMDINALIVLRFIHGAQDWPGSTKIN